MIFYQENFFDFDVFEIPFSNIFICRLDTFVG